MYWRVFFLGHTLIDLRTQNNQLPWGYSAAQSDYPYNRRDLTDTYVTREYFVVQAYRDGEFPLWNPYTMAGHPIYADGVTRTLSPFLLVYKFFDVPLGYSLARITELMLAAVFMYLFLISLGIGSTGSLIGSLVFELSAHSLLHLTGLGWWGGLLWLPLILLFLNRALRGLSFLHAVLSGVFLAAQFFCGYLPNQIYYVSAIPTYCLLYWWFQRKQDGPSLLKVAALAGVVLAVGLTLALTQWMPSIELLSLSNRKVVGAELGYIYLPPWYALTLIFPTVFGAAYDTGPLTLFTAIGVSHDHSIYIGGVGLLMASLAVYQLRSRPANEPQGDCAAQHDPTTIRIFAVIALLSALVTMGAPLYVLITRFIPVLQVIRVAVRAGVLFLFATSVLAAFGTDSFLSSSVARAAAFRIGRAFAVLAVAVFCAGIALAYTFKLTGFADEFAGHGKLAFLKKAAAVLSPQFLRPGPDLLLPIAVLVFITITARVVRSTSVEQRGVIAALLALLLVDLFWNARQYDRSYEASRIFPRTEITDTIASLPKGRVLTVPSDLESNRRVSSRDREDKIIAPPNTLLPYRISTVSGKNQQFPRWYREYASLIEPQKNLSHVVFDEAHSRFFDMLNVRYILTNARNQLEGYDLLHSAEGLSLYENRLALNRAFFAEKVVNASSAAEALDLLRVDGGPTATAVLERGSVAPQIAAVGSASIVKDQRNRVVVETDSSGDGLLVLSDNFYPGWTASVDGQRVEVLRANRTMRAVAVSAGKHVVTFAFRPRSFVISVWLSVLAAVLVVAYMMGERIRGGRVSSEC